MTCFKWHSAVKIFAVENIMPLDGWFTDVPQERGIFYTT